MVLIKYELLTDHKIVVRSIQTIKNTNRRNGESERERVNDNVDNNNNNNN